MALTGIEVKVAKEKSLLVQAELKGKDKRFENIIVPFMEEAQRTLKHLEDLYQETCSLFLDLCIYFGWPEAKVLRDTINSKIRKFRKNRKNDMY